VLITYGYHECSELHKHPEPCKNKEFKLFRFCDEEYATAAECDERDMPRSGSSRQVDIKVRPRSPHLTSQPSTTNNVSEKQCKYGMLS
jgi:hypothetical protein